MESNKFFATERPGRLFLKVALPGTVSMLAASAYNIAEGAFIGQLMGEAAFAAMNLGWPFVMLNFSLADLVGVGSSAPIAIALGQKDQDTANNYFSSSLVLIFLSAILVGAALFLGAPWLVRFMGAEGELADMVVRYVRIYAGLGPFTTVVFAMDNYWRISGFVKGSMNLNIFMTVLTVLFLWLFLAVMELGMAGAALASCCAMGICAAITFVPFLRGRAVLRFTRPRITGAMLVRIVKCGAPVFLNNVAGRVASILMNAALLQRGGQTAVAAYSVLMYAGGVLEPMLYGLTDSVQPAVGYNWGARQMDRVKSLVKWSFGCCGALSLVCTGLMAFAPRLIAGIFVAEGQPALMALTLRAMGLYCVTYLFRWTNFATQGFFSAIEKPLPATALSILSAMVGPIFFLWALTPLGLDGLWLNGPATAFSVMLAAGVMLRKVWRSMEAR